MFRTLRKNYQLKLNFISGKTKPSSSGFLQRPLNIKVTVYCSTCISDRDACLVCYLSFEGKCRDSTSKRVSKAVGISRPARTQFTIQRQRTSKAYFSPSPYHGQVPTSQLGFPMRETTPPLRPAITSMTPPLMVGPTTRVTSWLITTNREKKKNLNGWSHQSPNIFYLYTIQGLACISHPY